MYLINLYIAEEKKELLLRLARQKVFSAWRCFIITRDSQVDREIFFYSYRKIDREIFTIDYYVFISDKSFNRL